MLLLQGGPVDRLNFGGIGFPLGFRLRLCRRARRGTVEPTGRRLCGPAGPFGTRLRVSQIRAYGRLLLRRLPELSGRALRRFFRCVRFCYRQHARSVTIRTGRRGFRFLRGIQSFAPEAFAQSALIGFPALPRLLLGEFAVISELDRGGIAEPFRRRIGEELFFGTPLGRTHRAFEVLLEFGGQTPLDADLHDIQGDTDDPENTRDDEPDEGHRAHDACIFLVEIPEIGIVRFHNDTVRFLIGKVLQRGQIEHHGFGRTGLPRRIDRIETESELPDAVQLIGLRIVPVAVAEFLVLDDLAEQGKLVKHGVVHFHFAAVADVKLNRGAELSVFIVIRGLQNRGQRNTHGVGRDVRQHLVIVRVLDRQRFAEGVDRRCMEPHGADGVGGDRRLHKIVHRLDLIRGKVERAVQRRIDLVEQTDVRERLVARVLDGDDKLRALACRGVRLYGELEIDDDGFNRKHVFRRRFHFTAAGDILETRLEGHVHRPHAVLDRHGDHLTRGDLVRFEFDRLHALFRIEQLQSGHVEFGIVFDRVFHGERRVRAHAVVAAHGKHGELRNDEALDHHRSDRLALVRQKRRVAGLLVDDRFGFVP